MKIIIFKISIKIIKDIQVLKIKQMINKGKEKNKNCKKLIKIIY